MKPYQFNMMVGYPYHMKPYQLMVGYSYHMRPYHEMMVG